MYYENGARGYRHILLSEINSMRSKVVITNLRKLARKKKKVYIVETQDTCRDRVAGIFTSKKKALKYISEHPDINFELYYMQLNVGIIL